MTFTEAARGAHQQIQAFEHRIEQIGPELKNTRQTADRVTETLKKQSVQTDEELEQLQVVAVANAELVEQQFQRTADSLRAARKRIAALTEQLQARVEDVSGCLSALTTAIDTNEGELAAHVQAAAGAQKSLDQEVVLGRAVLDASTTQEERFLSTEVLKACAEVQEGASRVSEQQATFLNAQGVALLERHMVQVQEHLKVVAQQIADRLARAHQEAVASSDRVIEEARGRVNHTIVGTATAATELARGFQATGDVLGSTTQSLSAGKDRVDAEVSATAEKFEASLGVLKSVQQLLSHFT